MGKGLANLIEKEDSLIVPDIEFVTKFPGFGFTRYLYGIAKASRDHEGEVYLEDSRGRTINCKDMLNLMSGLSDYYCNGEKLRLLINGKTEYSRELAHRIYHQLTEENLEKARDYRPNKG